jgi:3'(2'), 5'-bisphosphate nucleotidase
MKELLLIAVEAAIEAGKKIMEVYAGDFVIEVKADKSPLTEADRKSHNIIRQYLEHTGMPFLSEEGKQSSFEERKNWETFWLVDPLDGTKEFIKRNGEFTVNIALIKNKKPVLGIVYVPVSRALYFGLETEGSFKVSVDKNKSVDELIKEAERLPYTTTKKYTIVASRSHFSAETKKFIEEKETIHGEVDLINAGSSLKLCFAAEGKAQIYPRLAPTMEWDTAAGHAVAKFAGCKVYDFKTKQELEYNKENLLNPWFVVERS